MTAPPAPLLAPPRPVPVLTAARVRATIDRACAGLGPEQRAQAAERIAARIRDAYRPHRYPTPGALAQALDRGTVQTPALRLIDRHLCAVGDGQQRRVGIFVPPQEGKSTRVGVFGCLWLLLRNPDLRIAIASYEQALAVRSGKQVRDYLDTFGSGTRLRPTAPADDLLGLAVAEDSASMSVWQLAGHRGGVVSVGIGSGFTGRPADVLLIDDPVKDARAADSPLVRSRAWDWWTMTARTRLSPQGAVILIQTRWHEDDLAGRLIADDRARSRRSWVWVNIPAQAEAPRPDDEKRGRLPDALGRPPGAWLVSARGRTPAEWEETRADVGGRGWAAGYQQHPAPTEGAVFRWVWFTRTRRSPDADLPASIVRAVAVDPSAGGSDEAGIVAGFRGRDGRAYLTHDRSGRMTSALWARQAWLLTIDTQADRLVWERNLAGPTMAADLRRAWALLQRQARVLARHGGQLETAGLELARADAGITVPLSEFTDEAGQREEADPEAVAEALEQLAELTPERLRRILTAPSSGPAALRPVQATVGKRTRATPVATAFETGRAALVGAFPDLEAQATTWQEGQDSPDRMDALVWLMTDLLAAQPAGTTPPPPGRIPTGPASRGR